MNISKKSILFLLLAFLCISLNFYQTNATETETTEENTESSEADQQEVSPENSLVIQLTNRNFQASLKKYNYIYVKFEDPSCGICKEMVPCWEKIAQNVKEKDFRPKIHIGNVDCTKQRDVCALVGVKSYPTLKFFSFGEAYDFDGNRVLGERCPEEFGDKWIYTRFDKTPQKKPEDQTLEDYLEENNVPTVFKFDVNNVQMIFTNNFPFLVIFSKDLKSKRKDAEDLMNDVADQIEGKILLVSATQEFGLGRIISNDLSIKYKDLPVVAIVEPKDNALNKYFLMQETGSDVNSDAIIKFYNDWTEGKAMRAYQSEMVPKVRGDEIVLKVVGRSFDEQVLHQEDNKDVIALFYRSEDDNYKETQAQFQKIARRVKKKVNQLVFVEFDATLNKHKDVNFQEFPNVQYYKNTDRNNPVEIKNLDDDDEFLNQMKATATFEWPDIKAKVEVVREDL